MQAFTDVARYSHSPRACQHPAWLERTTLSPLEVEKVALLFSSLLSHRRFPRLLELASDVLESLRAATQLSLDDLRDLQALAATSPGYGPCDKLLALTL